MAGLLRRADQVPKGDASRYGGDRRGDELRERLAFREKRLRKMGESKATLEAVARAEADTGIRLIRECLEASAAHLHRRHSRIMPGPGGRTPGGSAVARRWWAAPTR